MSIVTLAKVTLIGLPTDKTKVLDGLQRLGCIHLIPLREPEAGGEFIPASSAQEARQALRYLMDVRTRRHQLRVDETFSVDTVVSQALENQQQRRQAEDQILALKRRLEELEPWGDFALPALDDLDDNRFWFYRVPHPKEKSFLLKLEDHTTPWIRIYASPRHAYFVLIARDEPDDGHLGVPRSHVGSQSPASLRHQLDLAYVRLDDIEARHEALSRWIFLLSKHLNQIDDAEARDQAASKTRDDATLIQVQGWIPRRDLPRLEAFSEKNGLALMAEAAQPADNPPTLMRNPDRLEGGQDLVTFYETPGYRDWDPSIVVFFSFAVFFSMILADAGYAVVLALLIGLLWKSMGRTPGGRHFRILACVGLSFAAVYGVLAGSYFGVEPAEGSLLRQFKILDLNNYEAMMKLSIIVGCLHLIVANAIVAVREINISRRAKPLGWIAIILAGLLMYVGAGTASLVHLGIGLGVGGAVTILMLSSDRQVGSIGDALLRLLDGLGSLTNLSKLFGDVMSYLRLFALGLASASLALTFNQLAQQVYEAGITLAVPIALLILVLGHSINLLLAIISGFVHGLRLNYIEFFNWSLSEEGYPFEAFAKKELTP